MQTRYLPEPHAHAHNTHSTTRPFPGWIKHKLGQATPFRSSTPLTPPYPLPPTPLFLQDGNKHDLGQANPFMGDEDEELASAGYRYRKWALAPGLDIVVRCEVNSAFTTPKGEVQLCSVKVGEGEGDARGGWPGICEGLGLVCLIWCRRAHWQMGCVARRAYVCRLGSAAYLTSLSVARDFLHFRQFFPPGARAPCISCFPVSLPQALNEWNLKETDWRKKLDQSRASVRTWGHGGPCRIRSWLTASWPLGWRTRRGG